MLQHPTFEKLQTLRLTGMCKAWEDQAQLPDCDGLSFEERLGLLVDRELTERDTRRLQTRLRTAKLRQPATVEDLDYRHPRGLDKTLMTRLVTCQWIADHATVLITGPTGVGKTWLACALAHKACRAGYTAQYLRLPRLWRDLAMAKGDGRYPKLLTSFAKTDLLLLDDFGLETLTEDQRRDLLEILEDRHGTRATLVTSQLPTDRWHDVIGEPTLADAILDRLIHHAYKLTLKGDSMRKKRSPKLTARTETE
jgi:DNA replication protein DnaC